MIDPANALFEDARGNASARRTVGRSDSVALLVMLHECAPDVRLTCAHVEHGIRGRESLDDAAFCENLCRKMNVSLHIVSIDVPAESARTGEGLETAARRLRHEALERIRISVNADRIALAHHLNDQAETVLMHLLRGSGVKGACGMPRDDGGCIARCSVFPKVSWKRFSTRGDSNGARIRQISFRTRRGTRFG